MTYARWELFLSFRQSLVKLTVKNKINFHLAMQEKPSSKQKHKIKWEKKLRSNEIKKLSLTIWNARCTFAVFNCQRLWFSLATVASRTSRSIPNTFYRTIFNALRSALCIALCWSLFTTWIEWKEKQRESTVEGATKNVKRKRKIEKKVSEKIEGKNHNVISWIPRVTNERRLWEENERKRHQTICHNFCFSQFFSVPSFARLSLVLSFHRRFWHLSDRNSKKSTACPNELLFVYSQLTSDHSPTRQIGLQRSFEHVCLMGGFSFSSQASLSVSFVNLHWTLRLWIAVLRFKQSDCKQSVHSSAIHRGHSWPPHFSTVSGIESPASSHITLSTVFVLLLNRTIQCALRNCWAKQCEIINDGNVKKKTLSKQHSPDSLWSVHMFVCTLTMAWSSIQI